LAEGRTREIDVKWDGQIRNPFTRVLTWPTREQTVKRTVPTFFSEQNAAILNDLYAVGAGETIEFELFIKKQNANDLDFNTAALLTVTASSETNAAKTAALDGPVLPMATVSRAAIRATAGEFGLGHDDVEYVVSVSGMQYVTAIDLEFALSGVIAGEKGAYEALNGFAKTFGWPLDIVWENGIGKVSITYNNGITSLGAVDVAKFVYNASVRGNAGMKLTALTVYGIDGFGRAEAIRSEIEVAEAIVPVVFVYSKYDLNKDEKIDELDMIILVWYYQFTDEDAAWETAATVNNSLGQPVFAKEADFNGNAKVDLADLVELYLNYGKYPTR